MVDDDDVVVDIFLCCMVYRVPSSSRWLLLHGPVSNNMDVERRQPERICRRAIIIMIIVIICFCFCFLFFAFAKLVVSIPYCVNVTDPIILKKMIIKLDAS